MAKLFVLLCFVLLSGCLARREQEQENECQFQRLNNLKPDNRIESEGGFIETWNPNNKQFKCAGVALSRCTLNRNALRRPFFSNAPQEIYIQQGSGLFGMIFPGCPSNFEEPQREGQRPQDRHQKVHHFREGDLIAVPTGVAFWMYNPHDTPVVAVSLLDTNSNQNQLDQLPRRFYLAGNQEQEFVQYQQEQQSGRHQRQSHQSRGRHQQEEEEEENEGGNIFSGFSHEFLEDALNADKQIVRNIQGENEDEEKGAIVTVKGGLSVTSPPLQREQQEQEQEQEQEDEDEQEQRPQRPRRSQGRGKDSNGIDETICAMRLRHNIGQSSSPDIYNPQAGSIKTSNSLDFPALRLLRLSAEFGTLRKNAMFVPHYNLNANSIIYALNGRAWLQVVNCNGDRVFDGNLEEGQVLIVPQNFVVAARSQSDNFKYVSFKTNDIPMIGTLAGRNSLINAMPEEVIQHTFNLQRHQARQIKNNNLFSFLIPPRESHQRRAVA